ncbi:Protein CBG26465 [Caenorhabditis briggsae]|uniref:Protein CBG26465 n=1 Tax=Caenorhabditis briggsae TaxID=6238 RepID=B6IFR2_CAEBR|nr:Protein CBG26465 [Caenorhabditis briggsae]CAR98742.1 Protein CBG26465 [Caenorhabditis briggsae]
MKHFKNSDYPNFHKNVVNYKIEVRSHLSRWMKENIRHQLRNKK